MCPGCMTSLALTAASATGGLGVVALVVTKWRALRRRLRGSR